MTPPTDPGLPGTVAGTPVAPPPAGAPGAYSSATWPMELTLRPVVLGAGMLEFRGDLFIGLSKNQAGEPFQIGPSAYYGVNEQLTVGIFLLDLCFSGTPTCSGVIDSLGLDALFALMMQSNFNLAVRGSLAASSFDAGFWDLRVGVTGKLFLDRFALLFDPKLIIALNKRSGTISQPDIIAIPLDLQYQIDQQLAAVLTIGIYGPLDGFGDAYAVPVGFGAHYTLNRQLDIAGQFLFLNLLGKTFPGYGRADARALQFFVNYRFM